jgi:hypothetical protein
MATNPLKPIVIALTGPPMAGYAGINQVWTDRIEAVTWGLRELGYTVDMISDQYADADRMHTVCIERRAMGLDEDGCVTFYDPDHHSSFTNALIRKLDIASTQIVLVQVSLARLAYHSSRFTFAIVYGDLSADELGQQYIDSCEAYDEPESEAVSDFVKLDGPLDVSLAGFRWARLFFTHIVYARSRAALADARAAGAKMIPLSMRGDDIVADTVQQIAEGITKYGS